MILVIADDFSGAAEIAGAAHLFGLSAEVQTDTLCASDCDVVVVDANTRSLSPELAASVMQQLAPMISRVDPRWLFKKVDSVLRGAILTELNSLTDALDRTSCLLINANPRKGRIVRAGELLVEGRPISLTDFAEDPEHPRTNSSVVTLLGATAGQIRLVDRVEQVDASNVTEGIYVANVESSADLSQYAELRTSPCLLAGGAEFFESLLSAELGHSANQGETPLALQVDTLLVRGTSIRRNDQDRRDVPSAEIVSDGLNLEATIVEVCRQLSEKSFVTIAADHARSSMPAVAPQPDPEQLHHRLLELVGRVCDRCKPRHLWIEGGRTASGLIRARGWKRLQVQCVYADGVVGLRAVDSDAPSLVVKPGSYRWPIVNCD